MEKDWKNIVKKSGKRMTPLRKVLFEMFSHSRKPFSLEDIGKNLKKRGAYADFTTLCRQVDFFLEEGLIEQIDIPGRKRFFEKKEHHHHHFICSSCGEKQCLKEEKIHKAMKEIIFFVEKEGLHVDSHFFSLKGKCQACS
ncbi:MAG: hypothetical protein EOM19_02820 [Candidatus Moranbacteria bacterium]|nr:hypothetical protein [Candidatus Moranbacteria bacterium]